MCLMLDRRSLVLGWLLREVEVGVVVGAGRLGLCVLVVGVMRWWWWWWVFGIGIFGGGCIWLLFLSVGEGEVSEEEGLRGLGEDKRW